MTVIPFRPRFALRPYQTKALEDLRDVIRSGARKPLLVMPTGAGKAVCLAEMVRLAQAKGQRTLILAHRQELISQLGEKLAAVGVKYGLVMSTFPLSPGIPVQLGSVQTVSKRLDKIGQFGMIVIDEAHHATAPSYLAVIEKFPSAFLLGLTATPERLDGKGLGDVFDALVEGPTVKQLTKLGALCPFEAFSGAEANLKGVRTQMGEFNQKDLAKAVNKVTLVGDMTRAYLKHAPGLQAMAFGVTVDHARSIADAFNHSKVPAEWLSGECPKEKRARVMQEFRDGKISVLASCELFGEGIDVPAVGAVILARPTQSLTVYLQQVGRGLRPSPGKEKLIILDHAGNCRRHGLPTRRRLWSLQGRLKNVVFLERFCVACNDKVEVAQGETKCPECGTAFPVAAAKEGNKRVVETIAGRLERMVEADIPEHGFSWKKPLDMSQTQWERAVVVAKALKIPPICSREHLDKIAKERGYKPGWAWHTSRKLMGIEPMDDWMKRRYS